MQKIEVNFLIITHDFLIRISPSSIAPGVLNVSANSSNTTWIIDIGALDHITNDPSDSTYSIKTSSQSLACIVENLVFDLLKN